MKTNIKQSLIAATAILAFSFFAGCTGGGGSDGTSSGTSGGGDAVVYPTPEVKGSSLLCETGDPIRVDGYPDAVPVTYADAPIKRMNISKDAENHQENPNAKNILKRLPMAVTSTSADGNLTGEETDLVHPIAVAYAEQVIGDYELGDGSADIGDPTHADDIFVSLSLDDGKTWKKVNVSNTALVGDTVRSSIDVTWDGATVAYPGHSHKPTMSVNGNQILVGWHDKFCPSGDPLGLFVKDEEGNPTDELTNPDQNDTFKVNGSQGSINYNLDGTIDPNTGELLLAPNGKEVYEVPFSCIWTARGTFGADENGTLGITWYKPEQLTSGIRDANKLWIASDGYADVGFAMAWQEDPEGLREGKGAGPGEGWSGATTNHGADIWYTDIAFDLFAAIDENATSNGDEELDPEEATKPRALNNFAYPVRISDNEVCKSDDTKLYCQTIIAEGGCIDYVTSKDENSTTSGTNDGTQTSDKCVTNILDPLWDDGTTVILDGDTGASRPALSILRTNENEHMVILAYEETKGLSESDPGVPDQGETDTDIAVEGKVALFDSFHFGNPVAVSPGHIVNPRAPEYNTTTETLTGEMIFENARRVVIVNQVDACEQGNGFTFGIMYKQGVETRGGSSDMFVRMNTGFTADTFVDDLEDSINDFGIPNLSSMPDYNKTEDPDGAPEDYWTTANLNDETYTNLTENTFSPRGFMRGEDIFIGFEYTPNWSQTEQGNVPNTFYINRYTDGAWQGPQQISKVVGRKVSPLDPRFVATPRPRFDTTGLESDKSNPDVLFLSYGTFDMDSGDELDLFYTYSTDRGVTWFHDEVNATGDDNVTVTKEADFKITAIDGIEEMEVQAVTRPDGSALYNIYLQEQHEEDYNAEEYNAVTDHFGGLDSWSARVDFNATEPVE